jgi:cob(I)alamin adenosyltransferase
MSDRLTKIVTRAGDKGETSLGDGARVAKSDPRIALIGDVDELNSSIGVVLAHNPGGQVRGVLAGVQHDLFDLGGALSVRGAPLLSPAHVARIEGAAAEFNQTLPPLKEFILPGGAPLVAFLHVARALCRRVERSAVAFLKDQVNGAHALAYLNRLSDLLFIAARVEGRRLGAPEIFWEKAKSAARETDAD